MKLKPSEIILLWITGIALLIGLTYFGAKTRIQQVQDDHAAILDSELDIAADLEKLELRPVSEQELYDLKNRLPEFEVDASVLPALRTQITELASKSELALLNMRSEPDRRALSGTDDIFSYSITCDYSGNFRSLLRFLFDLQEQGAAVDVNALKVKPDPRRPGVLRGSFSLECAYREVAKAEEEVAAPGVAADSPAGLEVTP